MNNIAHYISEIFIVLDRVHSTIWLKVRAVWWGVKLGEQCKAQGRVYFKRRQNSSIIIGKGCCFSSRSTSNAMGLYCPCMFTTREKGAEIRIGDNCGFSGVRIRADLNVIIGNNVRCGANVLISDTDAHTEDPRAGKNAPVVIEDNVWVGMNVMVLKGVHIGKNSVIGAGSVVTRDIPANVVAAGVPCKVIKELNV